MNQIVLISNVMLETYWGTCIAESFSKSASNAHTYCTSYEEFDENITDLNKANFVVVCINFEVLYPNVSKDIVSEEIRLDDLEQGILNKCKRLYSRIRSSTNAKIIWFGFEDYSFHQDALCGAIPAFRGMVDRINMMLIDVLKGDIYIDLKRLIAKIGISKSYDYKGKYRWNAPYSMMLIALMAEEVHKQFLIHTGKTKKCLILDCDHVLWGGILSEDGIEGIQISSSGLGRPFQDFQRFLLDMYYHGVMLAVCSKNDHSDVLRVFREHSGMLLKQEHICCFRCNWKDKPSNIKAMSEVLNIGLDSMVFVDDAQFEIESVNAMLPEVKTILYHRDTVFRDLSSFFHLQSDVNMKTVKSRMDTYKDNEKREELRKSAISFDEYIASLEMKLDIHEMESHEVARVSELTQRTNKCTNGVRYTVEQLKGRSALPEYELYTVCLSDRFSDLGIVGVIGMYGRTIDLFSLSCRALGRKIEDKMIQYALNREANNFYYFSTSQNKEVQSLFRLYGLVDGRCLDS